MTTILGIRLDERLKNALEFQKTLTNFGCAIKTRIGLHGTGHFSCEDNGLILLEIVDEKSACALEKELMKIDNLSLGKMQL